MSTARARTQTFTVCTYCGGTIPEGMAHDCRQLQISALRQQVELLTLQVEALARFAGVELPAP